MKINVLEIKQGKVKEKEAKFTFALTKEDINDDRIELLSDLDIEGKVYYADDGVYRFDGVMTATCNFVCDRCGNTFASEYEAEFFEEFKEGVEEDDEDYYLMKNDEVDLSLGILKNFLLNIPVKLLCSEDCTGINYNAEEIYEKTADASKNQSPFSALSGLKFDK